MNAPISRSSVALLFVGAVAIFLLGAFSRFDSSAVSNALPPSDEASNESVSEPALPPNLSPELAEIFRMALAHVDQNVILTFIKNSGQTYSPTADQILYLADMGLSQNVIAALLKQKPSLSTELAVATNEPTTVDKATSDSPAPMQATNNDVFYNALAPYGNWTRLPEYGAVWQPTTETLNPDWRPYVDQGQWISTDNGWYWQSGYSWGWAPFHYGRWAKTSSLGWVWVPKKVWAPSWVAWRISLSYSGWAPLPPGVGLADAAWFTFVGEDNFLNGNLPSYALPPSQVAAVYARSLPVHLYALPPAKVVNFGPGQGNMIAATASKQSPPRRREQALATELATEQPFEQAASVVIATPEPPIKPRWPVHAPKSEAPKLQPTPSDNRVASWNLAERSHPQTPLNYQPVSHAERPQIAYGEPIPERLVAGPAQATIKSGK